MTSGHAIATLVVFLISISFVIHPVTIPTPCPIPQIPINLTTAPILAIALLCATTSLDTAVIRNGIIGTENVIPYNILILFFCLAYMSVTLDLTGILQAGAHWVSNKGGQNGWKLYLYFYVLFTLASILLANLPIVPSRTAFVVYYTKDGKLDPLAWVMAEFATANTASMLLFVANPTNIVICEGFSINNAAFTAYTILPFIACNIFCFAALAFQYRKRVPRTLANTTHQDPRSALMDPVGAIVGSVMLGMTLILCLVASFFGIDVWMIALPFAFAKFVFDLGWDHYRYVRGIPMLGRGSSKIVNDASHEGSAVDELQEVNGHVMTPRPCPNGRPPYSLDDTDSRSFGSNGHTGRRGCETPNCEWCSAIGLEAEASVSSPMADTLFDTNPPLVPMHTSEDLKLPSISGWYRDLHRRLDNHFPTSIAAFARLPFSLVPFVFSQFILIEALTHQGWVNVFATWLVRASHKEVYPTIWVIGIVGVILCNLCGTRIGATILLTKIARAAVLGHEAKLGAAIALAVASNIGGVGFVFSASVSGVLWRAILSRKGVVIRQGDFAFWNLLPLLVMTVVGLGVVSAEMAVLFSS